MNNLVLRVSRAGRLPAPGECAATGACAGSRGPGARAAGRAGQELGPGARGRRRGRPSTLPRTPRGRPRAPGDLGRAPQETEHPWSPRRGVTPEHRLGTYCVHSTGRSVQEPAGPPADCPSGQSPGPGSGDHGGSGVGGPGATAGQGSPLRPAFPATASSSPGPGVFMLLGLGICRAPWICRLMVFIKF